MKEEIDIIEPATKQNPEQNIPALRNQSEAQAREILAAVREWYPHVRLEEIPEQAWEFFLHAEHHSKTLAQIRSELQITESDVDAVLNKLNDSGDSI